ncbi:hypothetical protein SPBR_07124 [Sporothrix brasiliensis 5110]|uniref:SET domain-containing protein n=1 Tax=Sporothrix brasiliensis 5110 TaxID=1398154 RepID=A0A0C2ES90_9PEZI|nr:uncharacterized protein SPBR_07124 [Sporothrix brasiliensis 5110]KIH89204.1 hypothetical protein SPBR_07124 [Sporothrix brasiliensis 5110]
MPLSTESTPLLNNSGARRQETDKEEQHQVGQLQYHQTGQIDQIPVALGHDGGNTQATCSVVPAPWVKGNCRRGNLPEKQITKDTKTGEDDAEYCVYTHPSFSQGMGLSVITTASRLGAMATRPVFGGSEETLPASKGPTPNGADWPPDGDSVTVPAWSEQNVPGKDVGLVATRPIRRGERIMARTPAVMIDGAAIDALPVAPFASLLEGAASGLPEPHRAQFFNLSTNSGFDVQDANENEAYQIFVTNAFRTGIADGEPDLHTPNCAYFFDPVTLSHSVYAVVDIMQGEELTVAYIDPIQVRADRQTKLHRHWGFGCTCARCTLPPHRLAESDDRVRSIQALLTSLDNYSLLMPDGVSANIANVTVGPSAGELLVLLFELEGLHGRMHEAEYRLALEWNGVGDALRATQAARRCLDHGLLVRGAKQVFLTNMRDLITDPTAHWSWKFRLGKGAAAKEDE